MLLAVWVITISCIMMQIWTKKCRKGVQVEPVLYNQISYNFIRKERSKSDFFEQAEPER